jgi:hypothetical protein
MLDIFRLLYKPTHLLSPEFEDYLANLNGNEAIEWQKAATSKSCIGIQHAGVAACLAIYCIDHPEIHPPNPSLDYWLEYTKTLDFENCYEELRDVDVKKIKELSKKTYKPLFLEQATYHANPFLYEKAHAWGKPANPIRELERNRKLHPNHLPQILGLRLPEEPEGSFCAVSIRIRNKKELEERKIAYLAKLRSLATTPQDEFTRTVLSQIEEEIKIPKITPEAPEDTILGDQCSISAAIHTLFHPDIWVKTHPQHKTDTQWYKQTLSKNSTEKLEAGTSILLNIAWGKNARTHVPLRTLLTEKYNPPPQWENMDQWLAIAKEILNEENFIQRIAKNKQFRRSPKLYQERKSKIFVENTGDAPLDVWYIENPPSTELRPYLERKHPLGILSTILNPKRYGNVLELIYFLTKNPEPQTLEKDLKALQNWNITGKELAKYLLETRENKSKLRLNQLKSSPLLFAVLNNTNRNNPQQRKALKRLRKNIQAELTEKTEMEKLLKEATQLDPRLHTFETITPSGNCLNNPHKENLTYATLLLAKPYSYNKDPESYSYEGGFYRGNDLETGVTILFHIHSKIPRFQKALEDFTGMKMQHRDYLIRSNYRDLASKTIEICKLEERRKETENLHKRIGLRAYLYHFRTETILFPNITETLEPLQNTLTIPPDIFYNPNRIVNDEFEFLFKMPPGPLEWIFSQGKLLPN